MSVYFNFRFSEDPVRAFEPPAWCIDLSTEIRYSDGTQAQNAPNVEIDAVHFEGKIGSHLIWPGFWQPLNSSASLQSGSTFVTRLPLNREMVQAIERRRTGPIQFQTKFLLRVRPLYQDDARGATTVLPHRSEVVNSTEMVLNIDRDRWIALIGKLGWSEVEVFEVEAAGSSPGAYFASAFDELRAATDAFRRRVDPDVVLVHCYKALEGPAKQAGGGDKAKGFALLLDRALSGDSRKVKQIDSLIQAVNAFAHFGRHEDVPPVPVSFDEARFVLTTTLSVVHLLANRPMPKE